METAVVLAGHGSRAEDANASLRALAQRTAIRVGSPVYPAFLEMSEPAIAATIDAAIADGARRVVLVPYFLHPGNHVRRDLVEIADAARLRHPEVTVELAEFIGAHPGMTQIVAEATAAALAAR